MCLDTSHCLYSMLAWTLMIVVQWVLQWLEIILWGYLLAFNFDSFDRPVFWGILGSFDSLLCTACSLQQPLQLHLASVYGLQCLSHGVPFLPSFCFQWMLQLVCWNHLKKNNCIDTTHHECFFVFVNWFSLQFDNIKPNNYIFSSPELTLIR